LAATSTSSGQWAAQTIVLRMASTSPILSLTIGDATAQMGTNLSPAGVPSNSTDAVVTQLDGTSPSAGACYVWPGSVTVVSTTTYDVLVTAAASNPRLRFLAANPASYAACLAGEAVGTAMFPSATPPGAWVTNQAVTASRVHSYWVGLDIPWTVAPSVTIGAATLTITAAVHW
jgi:hypothetical protein